MGTALGRGSGTPLSTKGGGGLGHPLPSTLIGKAFFTLARSARKKIWGPFKSTKNPFWGTFELSDVSFFSSALRARVVKRYYLKSFGVKGVKVGI